MRLILISLASVANFHHMVLVQGRYDATQARNISNYPPLSMLQVHPKQEGPRVEAIFHNYLPRTLEIDENEATKRQEKAIYANQPSRVPYSGQKADSSLADNLIDENEGVFDDRANVVEVDENGIDEDKNGFSDEKSGFDDNNELSDDNEFDDDNEFNDKDEFDDNNELSDENEFNNDGIESIALDYPEYKDTSDSNDKNEDEIAFDDSNDEKDIFYGEKEGFDEPNPDEKFNAEL